MIVTDVDLRDEDLIDGVIFSARPVEHCMTGPAIAVTNVTCGPAAQQWLPQSLSL